MDTCHRREKGEDPSSIAKCCVQTPNHVPDWSMAILKGRILFTHNLKDTRDWVNQKICTPPILGSRHCSFVLIKGKWPSNLWAGSGELEEPMMDPHTLSLSLLFSFPLSSSLFTFTLVTPPDHRRPWRPKRPEDSGGVRRISYRKQRGCRVNLQRYRQDGRLPRTSASYL